ncbi:ketopantoate reductase family protein [Labilibaculum euxinus]|uniref:2-dehydropantoate 2-reductase n=1 Tax=Labilibaculum euxinus TaxID=2686357 RepID=A0A7M4D946_9BACT|nr:2-dehydropantoate 2-reductase [Labilibaculum euxinus]MUP39175.1 2-dehydropantoate 2-reductase [Labilibaculum euxinus]MVB08380.1 2-dehydropantoate 2-reductase [Labilibaculum euxinus]
MKQTHIYIVGAGAIGKALAVFLKRENKQVSLVRGSADNIPPTEDTIRVIDTDESFQEKITTTTFSNLTSINGIVLITTKTFANEKIAKKLKEKDGDFSIVLLQNGLNIERAFENFDEVYRCVLFSTSQVTNDNEVTFKAVTASPIGKIKGNDCNLNCIIEQINTSNFCFSSENNIQKLVWTKVIANCAFNSICPLLETDNGIFHRSPEAAKLAKIIIKECIAIAQTQGIELNADSLEENLMLISQRSDGQLISTYVDLLNKRKTEIESLNLEIANIANKMNKAEFVTNTRLLGELIKLKSELY